METVRDFYAGKTILITGASGFMGKVLVEKLLYSCSDLKKIFILMREKRGKSAAQRTDEFSKVPIFRRIMNEKPEVMLKVVPVYGDISSENLGLSNEDMASVINETNIIFHMAATVNFEAPLKTAVQMNVRGVKYVMDLAKMMPNICSLLHFSTAFCCVDQDILEERVYEWYQNPKQLIELANWMDEEAMDTLRSNLIKQHPNTYTYTKRIAETLVRDEFNDSNLPVCIVRPSIVLPAFFEPIPGWVDNLNGPVGVFLASGKGVIRSLLCNGSLHTEVAPVDFAINLMILIAWEVASMKQRPPSVPVYNVTVPKHMRQSWQTMGDLMRKNIEQYPLEAGIWYPGGALTTNKPFHYTRVALTQWLPALLIDGLCILLRRKPFLIKVQKKIFTGCRMLEYFSTRSWDFQIDKAMALEKKLNEEERKIFYFNIPNPDLNSYSKACILSAREHILKESPSTIPRSRVHFKILRVVDIVNSVFWLFLLSWFLKNMYLKFFSVSN